MSGMPSGTFLFLTPLASLTTFDDGLAIRPTGSEKLRPNKNWRLTWKLATKVSCFGSILGIAMCRMSLLRPIRGFGVLDRRMSQRKGTHSLTVAVLKARFSRERANFVCGASPNDSRPDRHFRALHDGRE
jgi:hypothetical protein